MSKKSRYTIGGSDIGFSGGYFTLHEGGYQTPVCAANKASRRLWSEASAAQDSSEPPSIRFVLVDKDTGEERMYDAYKEPAPVTSFTVGGRTVYTSGVKCYARPVHRSESPGTGFAAWM